jgi:ATP-dependent helicase/nuclease subunit B
MPVILHSGPSVPLMPFEERVRRSRMEGCLVILPTRRRVRHLARGILRLSPGAVAPALALHTLESLCRAMYAAAPGARPVMGGAARTLVFQQAARGIASSLRFFAPRGEAGRLPRGTFDRLVDVIINLKESGVYPDTLDEELALGAPDEQPKLRDVAAVYAAYESRLAAGQLEDLEGVYRYLDTGCTLPQFTALFRNLFSGVETVSLAGFDEFTQPELGILRKLCLVDRLSVTMMFDFLHENPDLFGHLEENYERLAALGLREAQGEEAAASAAFFFGGGAHSPEVRAATDHLARHLFRPLPPRVDLSARVAVLSGRNRVHEVELICKLIKRLCAEKPGRDLSGICVALHRPQVYTDIMREQFARYDIPVNITDRFDLSRSPVAVALLALLAVPLRGYRREEIVRALASPYVVILGDQNPGGEGPVDGGNLGEVARRLRITGGINTWREKIERGIRETDSAPAPDARERASLVKARSDIDVLERLLRPFTGACTPLEFAERFHALCRRIGLPEALIEERLLPDLAEKDIRAFTALEEIVDELAALLTADGTGEQPLRAHYDQLTAALGRERYNVRERFGEGVLVTSIDETRELPIDVMIVAGLVDGEFPSAYQPEVFFSARRRRAREQRHDWEGRYLFYQAVTNWKEQLYLTYPDSEGDVELVRSTFVDAFLTVAEARTWDRETPAPFGTDIGARSDFLRHYGAAAVHGTAPPVPEELSGECAGVAEAARVEWSRIISHDRPEYEGRIGGALPPGDALRLGEIAGRIFSASQLESYAGCPFQFFAGNVLRLREKKEFEEELSPGEKGSVLHETLFEFFRSRRDRGAPGLRGCTDGEFAEALAEAGALASARLDALEIPDVFWEIEKELILGSAERPGILRQVLEYERGRSEAVEPSFFEVSFGPMPVERSDPRLSFPEPVTLGTIALRGRVDRVDVGDGFFSIVDYKTGSSVPGKKEIEEGTSLQIPLYLHAVEQMLRAAGRTDLAPAGGFYLRLRDDVEMRPAVAAETYRGRAFPANARHRQFVPDGPALREMIDTVRRTAEGYIEGAARGIFPLTMPERVERLCGYCPYRTACRIQTLRHVTPATTEDA